jgi:hypothetical protein
VKHVVHEDFEVDEQVLQGVSHVKPGIILLEA